MEELEGCVITKAVIDGYSISLTLQPVIEYTPNNFAQAKDYCIKGHWKDVARAEQEIIMIVKSGGEV